jgi:hypothetical protein
VLRLSPPGQHPAGDRRAGLASSRMDNGRRDAVQLRAGLLTISIVDVTGVESGLGQETVEQAGPVLHPPESGLDQRSQLANVVLGEVGQRPFQVRPDLWGPKTCVTWPDAPLTVGCSARAACRGV